MKVGDEGDLMEVRRNEISNMVNVSKIMNEEVCLSNDLFSCLLFNFERWGIVLKCIYKEFTAGYDFEQTDQPNDMIIFQNLDEFFHSKLFHCCNEFFTQEQIWEISEIFKEFLDSQKMVFFTRFTIPKFFHKERVKKQNTKKSTSKVILKLSENLGVNYSEISSLIQIPTPFPTTRAAYGRLLSEIIEKETRGALYEAMLLNKIDTNDVFIKNPSPALFNDSPQFRRAKHAYDCLKCEFSGLKNAIEPCLDQIVNCKDRVKESLSAMFSDIENVSIFNYERKNIFQNLAALKSQKKEIVFMKQVKKELENNNPVLISNEMELFFKDEYTFRNNTDYNDNLIKYIAFKDIVSKNLIQLRQSNDFKSKKISRNQKVLELNKPLISPFSNEKFAEITDSYQGSISLYKELIHKILIDLDFTDAVNADIFKWYNQIEEFALNIDQSTLEWLKMVAESLKNKIIEKQDEYQRLTYQKVLISDRTSLAANVLDSIKNKRAKSGAQCVHCELSRVFVITTCGHSYCSSCFESIMSVSPLKCRYCKGLFEKNDVIKINWL